MSNFVDKVHEFFNELETKLGGMLHGTVADEIKADAVSLVNTARGQVADLVHTVEADASADLKVAEGDVSAAAGNAAKPADQVTPTQAPQIQPTDPANPAENQQR
jgi:hypothetical protein